MKRYLYVGAFFIGISALFGLCYYWSFKNALQHYNREAVEHNTELLNELLKYSNKSEKLLETLINENTDEVVEAAVSGETLRADASYFLETIYLENQIEKISNKPYQRKDSHAIVGRQYEKHHSDSSKCKKDSVKNSCNKAIPFDLGRS